MKLRIAVALVLAVAGIFLLLLAVDVNRWQTRIAADDVAYRTDPGRRDLWAPAQIVPGGAAEWMLGIGDDVRVRRALRAFKRGTPRRLVFLTPVSIVRARSIAQDRLTRTSKLEHDDARRAQELNLLGILNLIAIDPFDPGARNLSLGEAANTFRAALGADRHNADAAANLELTLRLLGTSRQQSRPGGPAAGGPRASSSAPGSGY